MAAGTSFVGRAQELALITALFERGERLITLLGPGGIGKTRLALRHAADAAIVCDLAEATTAAAMCEVLCDALDVTLGPRAKLEAAIDPIGHVLAAHGEVLVVLDNFEQLVEPGAAALARWLELATAARFLVTSRERLKLAREVVLDIGPLELATDAVALFVDRARAACATWQPAAGDAAAIAEIVRRLDGFPLAIELAAPRCRVLSPAELAARLADGVDILDRGPRDGAARHATLADAIAWSVASLRPAERAALAQCTVFRGGFTIAAAEAVIDGAPVVDLLQALADKSLVTTRSVNGAIRFDLYASIRELVAASDRDCEERHAAYFVMLGERGIAKAPGSDGRRLLELERENLVAAHARAAARTDHAELAARAALVLDDVLAWRGPLSANLAMLDAALAGDRAAALPPVLLARVLEARGRALDASGDAAGARAELERALALAIVHADRATEARTRSSLCVLARKEHRHADALDQGTQALALCRALGDVRFEAFALGALGAIALERGELAEAGEMMTRARDLARAEGDRWVAAMTGAYLGHAHHETGQLELAAATFDDAVTTFGALGDRRMAAVFSLYRVMVDHELGELDRARAGYELAIAANRALGLVRFEGLGRACAAAVHAQLGDTAAAAAELELARGLLARAGDPALVLACELHALHARIALPGDGPSRAEAAKRELVRGNPLVGESDDVRFAMRILSAAIARAGSELAATDRLVVGRDGRWFRIAGAEVSLARHRALRLLVLALAETRVRSPGRALDWEALLAIGWPGERVATGGAHRVQVAIATLRRRGLHDVLARRDDGYLLDPRTPVELATIDDV